MYRTDLQRLYNGITTDSLSDRHHPTPITHQPNDKCKITNTFPHTEKSLKENANLSYLFKESSDAQ